MRLISERTPARQPVSWPSHAAAAVMVASAATAASLAGDGDTAWYRGLAKPPWQPPPWAFAVVWTPLYASIAYAGGRALARTRGARRRRLAASLGMNLAVNASWSWLFFRLRRPRLAAAATVLLDISNADLVLCTARTDRAAAWSLAPYTAWSLFATALAIDIGRRNS
ncbi:TspO/MBR family protein [Kitasatospora sp. NPDC093679]|uniref:TspO/MBR family protein n=1 Tax=Kitasatospora sp. NPDC093679 TaxID=3154983 RepID=UPI0034454861